MWTSDTMTLSESIITFLIGFSIVFAALIALALFIIISSKVINALVKEEEVVAPKPVANVSNNNANTASAKAVAEKDNQEAENLAVIISAISEEREKMKYVVTVNGKKFEVEVEKVGGAGKSLSRQPAERRETVKSEPVVETKAAVAPAPVEAAPAATTTGGTTITSPMPGTILDVKVNVGDKVKYGQTLAILEAMKMENDIPATGDGEVAEIRVKKGDAVETDAVLIVLK